MGLICGDENAYLRMVDDRARWNGTTPAGKPLTAREARRLAERRGKAAGQGKAKGKQR